jgi:hypothetical protein
MATSLRGDSHQAILPDALRVNANLFQTDLCRDPRDPEAMDGNINSEHKSVIRDYAVQSIVFLSRKTKFQCV